MADIRKQGFHTVEANVEEMEQKIRRHRKRVVIGIAVVVLISAVSVAAAGLYFEYKEYRGYEVRSEIERNDSESTKYESFAGNILRYNNDGISYVDMSDNLIWNQAFEMQNPSVDICENFVAVADMQGSQIYIMDTNGVQGEISTNKPIKAICVANQGTIAVLTQEAGASYIGLYNKTGESLVSGETHIANSGYPLDIALSNDANKLALSILDISEGQAKTTVVFYNFGAIGQNEIDNVVGTYSYDNTMIPEISFVSNDRMIAFGDTQVILYEGRQKPEEMTVHKLEKELKSIFYDTDYFGLVYANGDSEKGNRHKIEIYDMKGNLRLEQEFDMSYDSIGFLKNHEICIQNDHACQIYTLRGVKKFACQFDAELYKIFSGGASKRYTFILDGVMERVKLK